MEDKVEEIEELKPILKARWAISCKVGDQWIALVERSSATAEEVLKVMTALNLPLEEVDRFFPRNKGGDHCPTFELMHMFHLKLSVRPKVERKGSVNV